MSSARERFAEALIPLTIEHASRIGFYRKFWNGRDLSRIRYIRDLERLPVLGRADLRSFVEQFDYREIPAAISHTSGTTGESVYRCRSSAELKYVWDFFSRVNSEQSFEQLQMTLVIENADHGDAIAMPTRGFAIRTGGWSKSGLDRAISILGNRYRFPNVSEKVKRIVSSADIFLVLTEALLAEKIVPGDFGIKEIVLFGHYLSRRNFRFLRRIWGAHIIDRFSCSEVFGGAVRVNENGWFIFDPQVVVEVVNMAGEESLEQGVGRLVLTELFPFSQMQPLIRYYTGDIVEVKNHGKHKIFRYLGREEYLLKTPDGRVVATPVEIDCALEQCDFLVRELHKDEYGFGCSKNTGYLRGRIKVEEGESERGENGPLKLCLQLAVKDPSSEKQLAEYGSKIETGLCQECGGIAKALESGELELSVNLEAREELNGELLIV